MNNFYVYGLFVEGDSMPFYIGKGKERRMYKHFQECEKGTNPHKDRKIEKAKRSNKEVYAKKIYKNLNENEAYMREWILINMYYPKLTNIETEYGNGGGNKGKETREKISRKVRKAMSGTTRSEETKRKISETVGKVTKKEASEIKWLAKNSDMTQNKIGDVYGVSRFAVTDIKREKNWSHVTATPPKKYEDAAIS